MTDIHYLLASTVLTFLMVLTAPTLRNREWTTAGMVIGFGNRDVLPEQTPLAGRADRAAKNMIENMVLFLGAFVACHAAGKSQTTGAAIFFFARLAYWFIYLIGIPYVRTLLWAVGLFGIGWIGMTALG